MKKTRTTRDRVAREQVEQLEIVFPGLLSLVEQKSMDSTLYPKKSAARDLLKSEPQTLAVAKGIHIADAIRRKA